MLMDITALLFGFRKVGCVLKNPAAEPNTATVPYNLTTCPIFRTEPEQYIVESSGCLSRRDTEYEHEIAVFNVTHRHACVRAY